MEEGTKKKLLYSAGAIASLVGLVWVLKKSASSSMPIVPGSTGTGSGAGSSQASNALEAAKIQAATALTVAQTNERIANAQVAASVQNNLINATTQERIAKAAENAKIGSAALGPGGAVATTGKSIIDTIKEFFGKNNFGNTEVDSAGNKMFLGASGYLDVERDSFGAPMALGASGYLGDSYYSSSGALMEQGPSGYLDELSLGNDFSFTNNEIQTYIEPAVWGDFFQGNTGSGDSSWFGSSPATDPYVYYENTEPFVGSVMWGGGL